MTTAIMFALYNKLSIFTGDQKKYYHSLISSLTNKSYKNDYERLVLRFINFVAVGSSAYVKALLIDVIETLSVTNSLRQIVEVGNGESFYIKVTLAVSIDLSAYDLIARDEETMTTVSARVQGTALLTQRVLVADYPFPEGSIRKINVYLENAGVQGENSTVLTSIIVLGTRTIDA